MIAFFSSASMFASFSFWGVGFRLRLHLAQGRRAGVAKRLFQSLRKEELEPDTVTVNSLMGRSD